MARIRTVKPEYPQHRKVRRVSRDARLLNIHLWNLADDEGRLQELVPWIIGAVFPADEDVTPVVLREWLQELSDAGLIQRYEVDGEAYIACHDFSAHQVINKKRPSELPPPPKGLNKPDQEASRPAPVPLPDQDGSPTTRKGTGKGREQGTGKGVVASRDDAPLSHLLADLVAFNGSKRPTIGKGWLDAERLLLERDGRDPGEAERLIRWCQSDEFWRGNVLSMPKFREQYDRLRLQAQRKGGHNGGGESKVARRIREIQGGAAGLVDSTAKEVA